MSARPPAPVRCCSRLPARSSAPSSAPAPAAAACRRPRGSTRRSVSTATTCPKRPAPEGRGTRRCANGECTACHNPHASRFDRCYASGRLPSAPAVTARGRSQGRGGAPPVAEGKCTACHQPHGSANAGLLREPGSRALRHLPPAGRHLAAAARAAPAVRAGALCGLPRGPASAPGKGLLKAAGAAICTSCHTIDARFRTAHHGYPVERASCQQCHDPHASSGKGLLRQKLHEPFASGDCSHLPPGPERGRSLRHADAAVPALRDLPRGHRRGGEEGRRSRTCRPAAATAPPATTRTPATATACCKGAVNDVCLSCHDPGGAKSGEKGRSPPRTMVSTAPAATLPTAAIGRCCSGRRRSTCAAPVTATSTASPTRWERGPTIRATARR